MTDADWMAKWFAKVTQPQLVRYNQRMSDARPYFGAPKWERMRDYSSRQFKYETTEPRQIYERAMADLEAFSEIAEETYALITQFEVAEIVAQAAE